MPVTIKVNGRRHTSPAYTRYPQLFAGARWIWSYNLVLDNVVIARKTVR